ncbi:MAG: hypothetical protein N2C14_01885, partial [Planctomycetales bacterium]
MQPWNPRVAVPLLIAFHVLALTGFVSLLDPGGPAASPTEVLFLGIVFGQATLIGIWVGLGNWWFLLRLVGGAIGVVAQVLLIHLLTRGPGSVGELVMFFSYFAGSATVVAITLLIARRWNVALARFLEGTESA